MLKQADRRTHSWTTTGHSATIAVGEVFLLVATKKMFYLYNVLLSSPAGSFVCWYSLPVRAYLLKTNTTQVYAPYRASQETKLWTKRFNSDCRQRCILVINEIFKTDCVHFYLEVIRWFFCVQTSSTYQHESLWCSFYWKYKKQEASSLKQKHF